MSAVIGDAPLRVVLFDMGGVLLSMGNEAGIPRGDFDRHGRRAMLETIREAGGRADEAMLDELLFAPWRAGYERRYQTQREEAWEPHLTRLVTASGARLEGPELLAAWFDPYGRSLGPLPGAREVPLRLAAAGLRLAIVSNVALPGRLYHEVLVRHHLATPFEALFFSCDAGSRKPSPAMIRAALARLGARPEEAAMVGDRQPSDVAAGRAAGVATVWLDYGRAGGPEPDRTIHELTELPAVIGLE